MLSMIRLAAKRWFNLFPLLKTPDERRRKSVRC